MSFLHNLFKKPSLVKPSERDTTSYGQNTILSDTPASLSEIRVDINELLMLHLILETQEPPADEQTENLGTSVTGMLQLMRVFLQLDIEQRQETTTNPLMERVSWSYTDDCQKALGEAVEKIRQARNDVSLIIREGMCPAEGNEQAFAFRAIVVIGDGKGTTAQAAGRLVVIGETQGATGQVVGPTPGATMGDVTAHTVTSTYTLKLDVPDSHKVPMSQYPLDGFIHASLAIDMHDVETMEALHTMCRQVFINYDSWRIPELPYPPRLACAISENKSLHIIGIILPNEPTGRGGRTWYGFSFSARDKNLLKVHLRFLFYSEGVFTKDPVGAMGGEHDFIIANKILPANATLAIPQFVLTIQQTAKATLAGSWFASPAWRRNVAWLAEGAISLAVGYFVGGWLAGRLGVDLAAVRAVTAGLFFFAGHLLDDGLLGRRAAQTPIFGSWRKAFSPAVLVLTIVTLAAALAIFVRFTLGAVASFGILVGLHVYINSTNAPSKNTRRHLQLRVRQIVNGRAHTEKPAERAYR